MKLLLFLLLLSSCTSREYDDYILKKSEENKIKGENSNYCVDSPLAQTKIIRILKRVDSNQCQFIKKIDTDYCHNLKTQTIPILRLKEEASSLGANAIYLPNELEENEFQRIEAWSYQCKE